MIGGRVGFLLLKALSRNAEGGSQAARHESPPASGAAKLARFFGSDVWNVLAGKQVLDYGCGNGSEAVAAALGGAERVFGLDVRGKVLESAARLARTEGVADRCVFLNAVGQRHELDALRGTLDVVYSLDCFEHYPHPEAVLDEVYELLKPGGSLLISFGPPWYHPYGAHMAFFCPLPWVQVLFREETILAVRALYRSDGATRFGEVDGGLNQMTVGRLHSLVHNGRFQVAKFQPVAVRRWSWLVRNAFLREYFTSVVTCMLTKPHEAVEP
jgi:SAM-dependent methyltransferase